MTVTTGDDCEHIDVEYRASEHRTPITHLQVHDFQCSGCEVCARIIKHVPVVPEEST